MWASYRGSPCQPPLLSIYRGSPYHSHVGIISWLALSARLCISIYVARPTTVMWASRRGSPWRARLHFQISWLALPQSYGQYRGSPQLRSPLCMRAHISALSAMPPDFVLGSAPSAYAASRRPAPAALVTALSAPPSAWLLRVRRAAARGYSRRFPATAHLRQLCVLAASSGTPELSRALILMRGHADSTQIHSRGWRRPP